MLRMWSKQENENEDVEPHAHIDGDDILNFLYYTLLAHPSSQVERMGGVFGQNCDYNTLFNCGPINLCPTFLLRVRRWVGQFFCPSPYAIH
jgi:hypothetical protein